MLFVYKIKMKTRTHRESYCRHVYLRVSVSCANLLNSEADILGFQNRSLLIRYLLGRRNLQGPLYTPEELKILKQFRAESQKIDKRTKVVSVKLQDSVFHELDSEWQSRGFHSLPSYLTRVLESRYLHRETRFFYEDS